MYSITIIEHHPKTWGFRNKQIRKKSISSWNLHIRAGGNDKIVSKMCSGVISSIVKSKPRPGDRDGKQMRLRLHTALTERTTLEWVSEPDSLRKTIQAEETEAKAREEVGLERSKISKEAKAAGVPQVRQRGGEVRAAGATGRAEADRKHFAFSSEPVSISEYLQRKHHKTLCGVLSTLILLTRAQVSLEPAKSVLSSTGQHQVAGWVHDSAKCLSPSLSN